MNAYNVIAHTQYSLYRKCSHTGWKIDTRKLTDHELVLITSGKGKVTIENTTYPLKQGTLLYFYPGLEHSLISCNDHPMSFYGIHFKYINLKYANNQWSSEDRDKPLPIKVISEVFAYPKVEGMFKKINTYWNEKSLGFEMVCRGALLELLYCSMNNTSANYSSRIKIERLLTYINQNLQHKITVNHLAEMVELSPDYLAAQFKSITGYTIIQYINQCRIDRAKILLLNGELRVKDIAAMVGFNDEFYFSKVFKQHEGISPLHFIKSMR